jgi:hypothetical protein
MKTKKKDPFKWLRDIRKKHYEETKNMTSQERIEYYRKKVKHFKEWQENRKK